MTYEVKNIIINLNDNDEKSDLLSQLKEKYKIEENNIKKLNITKRSIDSRSKAKIKLLYNIEVELTNDYNLNKDANIKQILKAKQIKREAKNLSDKIAIAGMGPAGIFAALRLVKYGFEPIIFEQGDSIEIRSKKVEMFWKHGILDEDSNVQFGEGGAGTFSDGKLTTRVKSEYISQVFQTFVKNGAPADILYDFKPHIGTDVLKGVIINIRKYLQSKGVKIYFNSKLTDLDIKDSNIRGITINANKTYDVDSLILAIGHSARKTYKMLYENNVRLENKDFAVGFRIEHPREIIDKMQYGKHANHSKLGAATYSFTYNNKASKKGVFTFCMCPGGEIVNAASTENTSLSNGMSYHSRNGKFSNSAIVCTVGEKDYGTDIFSGMNYQQNLERQTYNIIKNYGGLGQNLFDYLEEKIATTKFDTSYKMPIHNYDLNKILPKNINGNIKKAFSYWKRNKYFVSREANIIGLETRTSAPVRITRDIQGRSVSIDNLYPIGEGAGYAGGIVSAAVDGIRIVDKNFTQEYINE